LATHSDSFDGVLSEQRKIELKDKNDSYLHDQQGEMDNFLKHFKEDIMTLHEQIGVPIVGTWVNRPQNEFIWVRRSQTGQVWS